MSKDKGIRILALYLPQFHNIPENDEWWGDGFTEWTNVRAAKPLFEGHDQPKVPLHSNYYDLLDDEVKKWQVGLAKEYGIYGFCYYHYWFNGKMLLEKPMEQMLNNTDVDLPFCVNWANETWTKAWVGDEKKILIKQEYGDEQEWRKHFDYLLPFFKDRRYIKIDNKPLFIFYRPEVVPCLSQMIEKWSEWARQEGFSGISFMSQSTDSISDASINKLFDYAIEFQPSLARAHISNKKLKTLKLIRRKIAHFAEKFLGIDLLRYGANAAAKAQGTNRMSYDKVWTDIITSNPSCDKAVAGAYVMWDNSPRHGNRAVVHTGASPEKFKEYMSKQIRHVKNHYKNDFLVMYAWNEWAEGGYLEPDQSSGYGYLEGIKSSLIENGEWPVDYSTDIHSGL